MAEASLRDVVHRFGQRRLSLALGGPLMDHSRSVRHLAYHQDVLEDFISQLPEAVLAEAFELGLEDYLHNEQMKEIRERLREMG